MTSRPLALLLVLGLVVLAAACGGTKITEETVCGAARCDACIGALCSDGGTADAGP